MQTHTCVIVCCSVHHCLGTNAVLRSHDPMAPPPPPLPKARPSTGIQCHMGVALLRVAEGILIMLSCCSVSGHAGVYNGRSLHCNPIHMCCQADTYMMLNGCTSVPVPGCQGYNRATTSVLAVLKRFRIVYGKVMLWVAKTWLMNACIVFVFVGPHTITMGDMPPISAVPVLEQFQTSTPVSSLLGLQAAPVSAQAVPGLATHHGTPVVASAIVQSCGVPAGMFLGDGLMPLPARLVQRIAKLEFVEMAELHPKAWLSEATEAEGSVKCCGAAVVAKRRRVPVTDTLTRAQCYAALVGVLSTRYPQVLPSLMAYQAIITKASKEFDGVGWVQYDRAFKRQAAVTKDLQWEKINTTLYSVCFAGKAKVQSLCSFCLCSGHPTTACPESMDYGSPWRPMQGWNLPQTATPTPRLAGSGAEVCRLFNHAAGPRCHYASCKFRHACTSCGGPHPRSKCQTLPSGGLKAKKPRFG